MGGKVLSCLTRYSKKDIHEPQANQTSTSYSSLGAEETFKREPSFNKGQNKKKGIQEEGPDKEGKVRLSRP